MTANWGNKFNSGWSEEVRTT